MRYTSVLLTALSAACSLKGFDPFGASQGPHIYVTAVMVTPTVVHAGSPFLASASAATHNCGSPEGIGASYADQSVVQSGTTFSQSFTAVLGHDVVTFYAECGTAGGPTARVAIQVLPAP